MGLYINPDNEEKETFLEREALKIGYGPPEWPKDDKLVPVCLVDNGYFTAAAICYSPKEMEAFDNPNDYRPKTWYIIEKSKVKKWFPNG